MGEYSTMGNNENIICFLEKTENVLLERHLEFLYGEINKYDDLLSFKKYIGERLNDIHRVNMSDVEKIFNPRR